MTESTAKGTGELETLLAESVSRVVAGAQVAGASDRAIAAALIAAGHALTTDPVSTPADVLIAVRAERARRRVGRS